MTGTNIKTFDEPGVFVKCGLFKYARNPMYIGFVMALFGIALLYQGSVSSFVIAFLFFIISDQWYVRFEERGR